MAVIKFPQKKKYEAPYVVFCEDCKHDKPRSANCKIYPAKGTKPNCTHFEEKVQE